MRIGLTVELGGDQIVVSQPGTRLEATYVRTEGEPGLVLLAETVDPDADRAMQFKFRADAFAAATRTARRLGWV